LSLPLPFQNMAFLCILLVANIVFFPPKCQPASFSGVLMVVFSTFWRHFFHLLKVNFLVQRRLLYFPLNLCGPLQKLMFSLFFVSQPTNRHLQPHLRLCSSFDFPFPLVCFFFISNGTNLPGLSARLRPSFATDIPAHVPPQSP